MTEGEDTREEQGDVEEQVEAEEQGKESGKGTLATWLPIVISFVAFIASVASAAFNWYWNSSIGQISPLELSAYAIVRGVDVQDSETGHVVGPFPSDHIVLPLDWQNDSGRTVSITKPRLVVSKIGRDGGVTADSTQCFALAGEYADMSDEAFKKPYTVKHNIFLQPHSITHAVLVFHTPKWYQEGTSDYEFQFPTDYARYRVDFEFQRRPDPFSLRRTVSDELLPFLFQHNDSGEHVYTVTMLPDEPIGGDIKQAGGLYEYGEGGQGWDYWELNDQQSTQSIQESTVSKCE